MSVPPFPFGFGAGDSAGGNFNMNNLGAMFTQFGQMLQQAQNEGALPWSTVMQVARQGLGTDPVVSDAEQRAVQSAMELADIWLDPAVTFPVTDSAVHAWSRTEWLVETAPIWQAIVTPIAETMAQRMSSMIPGGDPGAGELGAADLEALQAQLPDQLKDMIPGGITPEMVSMLAPMLGMVTQLGATAFAYQLGQALAALAQEVLSSTDVGIPLAPAGTRALIPRNIAEFADGLGVESRDIMLFLALRESAHQRLFDHVPWLRPRLLSAVEEYARYMDVNMQSLGDQFSGIDMTNPQAIQEIMASGVLEPEDTPEQRAAVARLETLLALIEGWVDDCVTEAVGDRLGSLAQLRESMGRRRATGGPAERTFSTLVGMQLRPRTFREAHTVFAAIRSRSGIEARDALWAHPDLLPTAEDLQDPLGFVEASTTSFDMGDFDSDQ
ncbi:MAG: zinc-dependent metalloprotease [Candidatus Nanopelagicales bacterium]|nr:zinc-dependent metalloprotease [Candidatus Nanopelagicales bacterium]MCF8539307.1 zinc-dependent metalloprotease [Candidatus Nanopelagicales bacterium]MCF8551372.1 zinc-dependent metalloprotease [Candidatus Nanopelagicales bacterium]